MLAAVEHDPIHAATHLYNFPLTRVICRDIRQVEGSELLRACREQAVSTGGSFRELDLLVGGPPCQGVSIGGLHKRRDPRNDLLWEFHRMVIETRPKYFVLENVPGLVGLRHRAKLEALLRSFERNGYRVVRPVRLIDAAEFGVPQRRLRVIVLGYREDQAAFGYPEAPYRSVSPRKVSSDRNGIWLTRPTVRDAIYDLAVIDHRRDVSTENVQLTDRQVKRLELIASDYVKGLRKSRTTALAYRRLWDKSMLNNVGVTAHSSEVVARFAAVAPGERESISRFHRLTWTGVAPTLRAGTGLDYGSFTPPRPIHPDAHRVITVREAARLHSFPDWFRCHATKWHTGRRIPRTLSLTAPVDCYVRRAPRIAQPMTPCHASAPPSSSRSHRCPHVRYAHRGRSL